MQWYCHGMCCAGFFTGTIFQFIKKRDEMICLLSKVFSLFFFFKFPRKGGKSLFFRLYQVVFIAKARIITQPLNMISMLPRLHTSLFNKGRVPVDKIGRDLDHCGVILFSCYQPCWNDIRLEIT